MPIFILHGGEMHSSASSMFLIPFVVGLVAAGIAGIVVLAAGWRAGIAAAGVGVALLGAGFLGDLTSHHNGAAERHRLLDEMRVAHSAAAVERLVAIDAEEMTNPWHLVTAAGTGLLVFGLAGAAGALYVVTRQFANATLPAPTTLCNAA